MKRKIIIELLMNIPQLMISFTVAYGVWVIGGRFGFFGLSQWQYICVTFVLGAALGQVLYHGVSVPLVDAYILWDLKRRANRHSDSRSKSRKFEL